MNVYVRHVYAYIFVSKAGLDLFFFQNFFWRAPLNCGNVAPIKTCIYLFHVLHDIQYEISIRFMRTLECVQLIRYIRCAS